MSLRGLDELEHSAVEVLLYSSFLDASQEPLGKGWRQEWDGLFDLEQSWTAQLSLMQP